MFVAVSMPGMFAALGAALRAHSRGRLACGSAGAAVGYLAWHPGASLLWLLALPALWSLTPLRSAAYLTYFGYYLGGARDVPASVVAFDESAGYVYGYALWVGHAALLTLPWGILWPSQYTSAIGVALRFLCCLACTLLPPLGLVNWLNPLIVAGTLWPHFGWNGLGLTAASMTLIAVCCRRGINAALALAMALFLLYWIARPSEVATPPQGWVALNTHYPKLVGDFHAYYARNRDLAAAVRRSLEGGARVVVLPEEIAGLWTPASAYWWEEIDRLAAARGATVLVGAEVAISGTAKRIDALVVLGKGSPSVLQARQPLPLAEWKPWAEGGMVTGWERWNGLAAISGRRVAISVCYEDTLTLPLLLSFAARPAPSLIISVANNWWAQGSDEPKLQEAAISAWAALFGVPLIRAVNRT